MMVVANTYLPLPLFKRGKVRDIYDLGDRLLIITTDRVSAFDFVLPNLIPGKGKVLNLLSAFWFSFTKHIIPNHLLSVIRGRKELEDILGGYFEEDLLDRSMVVRKAEVLPVEVIVRGYLFGSAWEEYSRTKKVGGIDLPSLKLGERLPQPILTPATKVASGHDQPLSEKEFEDLIGEDLAQRIKDVAIRIYLIAEEYALKRGVIIADTKMEFGLIDGKLHLIDELLTPDSSRFWDGEKHQPGSVPVSWDKQFVRDWLSSSSWDKESPPPPLPEEVVKLTSQRYWEIYHRLISG